MIVGGLKRCEKNTNLTRRLMEVCMRFMKWFFKRGGSMEIFDAFSPGRRLSWIDGSSIGFGKESVNAAL